MNIELAADWESGDPVEIEPEKIGDWAWYSINEMPEPAFIFSLQGIESLQTGKNYFDVY